MIPLPVMLFIVALLLVPSCTKAQSTAVAVAGIDSIVCVLNHSQEPVEQIVRDCDGVTAEDVVKILDAHKGAEDRERAQAAVVK